MSRFSNLIKFLTNATHNKPMTTRMQDESAVHGTHCATDPHVLLKHTQATDSTHNNKQPCTAHSIKDDDINIHTYIEVLVKL